jgi:pyruvate dehydrogenase complex dehydrogenase (E1) component
MSEFEPKLESKEQSDISPELFKDRQEKIGEIHKEEAEKAEAGRESLEVLQEKVEKAAKSREQTAIDQAENKASESAVPIGKNLKDNAYKQSLRSAQRQMKPAQRRFSKFIHKRGVEAVSNVSSATVARPSGLLVGGLFSVISSLVILYICRHYGYEYNFFVGLASFAGGFLLGVFVEGVYRLFKRER